MYDIYSEHHQALIKEKIMEFVESFKQNHSQWFLFTFLVFYINLGNFFKDYWLKDNNKKLDKYDKNIIQNS